jgi:hypothetical protein
MWSVRRIARDFTESPRRNTRRHTIPFEEG